MHDEMDTGGSAAHPRAAAESAEVDDGEFCDLRLKSSHAQWVSPPTGCVAWYDTKDVLDASYWFDSQDIEPTEAAALLCHFNPRSELEQARTSRNEATGPEDFLRLERRFKEIAKRDPPPRSLLQWLKMARQARLHYHPWIDEYVVAAGLAADELTAEQTSVAATLTAIATPLSTSFVDTGSEGGQHIGKQRKKRLGWQDTNAWDYAVETLRSGNFGTCKDLYAAMFEAADSSDSPFTQGTGMHRGHLFNKELKKPVALQTMQNAWAELSAAAAKKR